MSAFGRWQETESEVYVSAFGRWQETAVGRRFETTLCFDPRGNEARTPLFGMSEFLKGVCEQNVGVPVPRLVEQFFHLTLQSFAHSAPSILLLCKRL